MCILFLSFFSSLSRCIQSTASAAAFPWQVCVLTLYFPPSTWEFSETQDGPMYRTLTLVWVIASHGRISSSLFFPSSVSFRLFSLRECTGSSTNISSMPVWTTTSSRKSFNFFSHHLISELRKPGFGDFYQFLSASSSLLLLMRFPTRLLSDG